MPVAVGVKPAEVAVFPTRGAALPNGLQVLASVETENVTEPVGAGNPVPESPVTVAVSWMV